MFETLFGVETPMALRFLIAFAIVLLLIGATFWVIRRFGADRIGASAARGRQPRLAVLDAAPVDGRRRLVLVRRDNVEHLLLIGGPSDIVVESNIVRAVPVALPREMPAPARTAAAADARAPEPPPMRPVPEPALRAPGEAPLRPAFEPGLRPGEPLSPSVLADAEGAWPPPPLTPEMPTRPLRPRPPGTEFAPSEIPEALRPARPHDPRRPPLPLEARVLRPGERQEPVNRGEPMGRPEPLRPEPIRPEPIRPEPVRLETRPEPPLRAEPPRPELADRGADEGPVHPEAPIAPHLRAEDGDTPDAAAHQPPEPRELRTSPPTADADLAEMAQRLEAALRRPFSPEATKPPAPEATAPGPEDESPAKQPEAEAEAAPRLAPEPPSPPPAPASEPPRAAMSPMPEKTARAEPKPPAKSVFDSLEEEMASLLGRPKSKE